MAEYISREAVCYQLEKQASIDGQPRAIRRARRIVANFPAADVAPVVHAHWAKEYTLGWYDGEQNYKLICPACNYSYLDNHLGAIAPKHFNYCPNCGAKMDEEVDK